MESKDLEYYETYLRLMENAPGIRLIVQLPDEYIKLLRENERLRKENSNYHQVEAKYGMELIRAIQAEDKLKYLRNYLHNIGVVVPNFKW